MKILKLANISARINKVSFNLHKILFTQIQFTQNSMAKQQQWVVLTGEITYYYYIILLFSQSAVL